MSLLLFFGFAIPAVGGTAQGSTAPAMGSATATFVPAPEVITLVLPIQTTIALTLPIGKTPPPVVPPWALA